MNKKHQVTKYLIFDFLAAVISWTIFFIYRKKFIEPLKLGTDVPIEFTTQYYLGAILIPLFWILFYYITGFYKNIYRKSRLIELGQTVLTSISGVVVIFFIFILDDFVDSYKNYYQLFFTLLGLHFGLTYSFRLILTTRTIHKIHNREIGFSTLLIGSNEKAIKIYEEMSTQVRPAGNQFIGYVSLENDQNETLSKYIPKLGTVPDLIEILEKTNIEEAIIAVEAIEHKKLSDILTIIENRQITIWGIPELYDFLSGTVKINNIYSSPLIKISNGIMVGWQENVKRLLDVVLSALAITVFLPVFLLIAILIKRSSKGSIFYSQERLGRFGKPFTIYKFRSMVSGAEENGPALSSKEDSRITPIGKFLRKTHLDEIPQFYNVIRGDMSLVGPRPERKFYYEQIIKKAPHYMHLHKLRPGITSWGQVKYGYASDVEQMLERLPYDMIYLKNISLYIDFKILIFTLRACFKGQGK